MQEKPQLYSILQLMGERFEGVKPLTKEQRKGGFVNLIEYMSSHSYANPFERWIEEKPSHAIQPTSIISQIFNGI